MNITLPEEKVNILHNSFLVTLNKEGTERIVPQEYDIKGISLEFTDKMKEVRIQIGGQTIARFDKDMKDDLKKFPIYLTLSTYHYTCIEFVFDIDNELQYDEVDEYEEVIEETGEEMEFVDRYGEVHWGKQCIKKMVPNGRKKQISKKQIEVTIPTLQIELEQNNHTSDKKDIKFREKIDLTKVDDKYRQRLVETRNLTILNDKIGMVDNYLRYASNMAGVYYSD